MSQKLHIFTVASDQNHHLDRLQCSAEKFGIKLDVLGLGQPYLGNGQKITFILDYLRALPVDDLFLFVDAYDVIFLTGQDEILTCYNTDYQGDLVFGAERNFGMYSWDDLYQYLRYPVKGSFYRFLNSGTIMGPVQKAIDLYSGFTMKPTDKMDQLRTIRYFIKHPETLVLDTTHTLFGVTGGRVGLEEDDYRIENGRLYAVQTDSWPCIFHVPGKFFPILDSISYRLGVMDRLPLYTRQELTWLAAQSTDNRRCAKLGWDPYVFRLVKQWIMNLIYIAALVGLVKGALNLFY